MDGRLGVGLIAFVNSFRLNMYKEQVQPIVGKRDPSQLTANENWRIECVTRWVSLLLVTMTRADCIAVKVVLMTLLDTLRCTDLSPEANGLLAGTASAINSGRRHMFRKPGSQPSDAPWCCGLFADLADAAGYDVVYLAGINAIALHQATQQLRQQF